MTGPEHYREAERLLKEVRDSPGNPMPNTIAGAQAHATLALTAATAESIVAKPAGSIEDRKIQTEWSKAIS